MIQESNGQFILSTDHTTYCFRVLPTGHLEHQYYGASIDMTEAGEALNRKTAMLGGNGISYTPDNYLVCLEDLCLEMSALGHGDVRTPTLDITWWDGIRTTDFLFERYEITEGKTTPETLPGSIDAEITFPEKGISEKEISGIEISAKESAEELHIFLKDCHYAAELEMIYAVFPACDVITRRLVIRNLSADSFLLHSLMSLQLDLDDSEYIFHTFTGHWAREMNHQQIRLRQGRFVNESRCGISSSMNNPFVMLSRPDTSETAGECMGFNLIYSGNHMECAEVNGYGETRILTGLNPEGFTWEVHPGESFESPEAVMTWSANGFTGMSHQMHHFVREHIVRGQWKHKERPILLNSWEAMYFDFNEEKLVHMAEKARDTGIELFVMDDGWFGHRNDARSSLGDWYVNTDKLPGGLSGLAGKIRDLGLQFGIWVEPEMISVDSDLYREHPDWSVEIPDLPHSEGRFQRILDLTREDVQQWLIDTMSSVFSSDGVTYVKWDNNRIFTDCFSRKLDRQTEFLHRYYMGYYKVMKELVSRFPHILFEGCASGGNRFDLGVLCYMPQIWASDNTDPICRTWLQSGLSYGYPMSVVGSHVSASPNHQTSRRTSWGTRFAVAASGVLGYELNLSLLTEKELEVVKEQIRFYKKYRRTLQFGDTYRLVTNRSDDFDRGLWQWMSVSKDRKEALAIYLMEQTIPNQSFGKVITRGLDENARYHFTDWQAEQGFGTEEKYTVSGSLLNHAGIKLIQACSTPGNRPGTRHMSDSDSRIYVMERKDAKE